MQKLSPLSDSSYIYDVDLGRAEIDLSAMEESHENKLEIDLSSVSDIYDEKLANIRINLDAKEIKEMMGEGTPGSFTELRIINLIMPRILMYAMLGVRGTTYTTLALVCKCFRKIFLPQAIHLMYAERRDLFSPFFLSKIDHLSLKEEEISRMMHKMRNSFVIESQKLINRVIRLQKVCALQRDSSSSEKDKETMQIRINFYDDLITNILMSHGFFEQSPSFNRDLLNLFEATMRSGRELIANEAINAFLKDFYSFFSHATISEITIEDRLNTPQISGESDQDYCCRIVEAKCGLPVKTTFELMKKWNGKDVDFYVAFIEKYWNYHLITRE